MERRIFIYGTGNMAWALAQGFLRQQVPVAGIYGRHAAAAEELCARLGISHCMDIEQESRPGDWVILAVKDDALSLLNDSLRLPGRLVTHTAGSVEMDAIRRVSEHIGVFYPMERVIKYKEPDFRAVPLCIETGSPEMREVLHAHAQKLSDQVFEITSEQRQQLHLAAVFVSNFTTYLLSLGDDLIKKYNLPPTILNTLVQTTFDGITPQNASERQTGPARRADVKIIWSHIHRLEKEQPELAELYKMLSLGILKRYNLDSGLC